MASKKKRNSGKYRSTNVPNSAPPVTPSLLQESSNQGQSTLQLIPTVNSTATGTPSASVLYRTLYSTAQYTHTVSAADHLSSHSAFQTPRFPTINSSITSHSVSALQGQIPLLHSTHPFNFPLSMGPAS